MSRRIVPMLPESDRHFVIRSYGDQEPPGPEPASRSPSPDIPPNFVPEAPKDSSNFPACSNIINLIERISGGVKASEQIIVPAHIWDRNNTHWEHRMIQLKRKHRKELTEKETEIRIKYDQLYSEARYRDQLLAKEIKELEFAQGVTGSVVLGKTWKEHKAAKKDMEEKYVKKIESMEKELTESLNTTEGLRKALAGKQTAIEALEKAIGKRDNQALAPEPQQSIQQPMQLVQPQQSVQAQQPQQLQSQYYPQQQSTSTLGTTAQTPFQMAQAIFQQAVSLPYAQQQRQQQQQQQGTENSLTLFNGGSSQTAPQLTIRPIPFGEQPTLGANVPLPGSAAHYNSGKTKDVNYQNTMLHGSSRTSDTNEQGNDKGSQHSFTTPTFATIPGWKLPFGTPQTPQTNIEVTTNQPLHLNDTGLRSTYGLSGPFGTQNQGLVISGPTFGQTTENSIVRLEAINGKERPSEIVKSTLKVTPHSGSRFPKAPLRPSKAGPQTPSAEKTGSQKRQHSPFPIDGHVRSQASGDQQARDLPSIQKEDSSEDEDDGEANAFPKKRKYQQSQSTTLTPFKSSGKASSGIFVTGSSSTMQFRPKNMSIGQKNVDRDVQDTRVDKLRKRVQGVGTQAVERVSFRAVPPLSHERVNLAPAPMRPAKQDGKRAIFVTLKRGLGWTGPAYIISKVRGGQLESIKVVEEEHKVYITFLSPDAAQTFHDFFNIGPDALHADSRFKMDVQWSDPANPEIPSSLAEAISCGATRCLKVFQVSKDKRPEDIKMDLNLEEPWNITDFLIVDGASQRKNNQEATKIVTIDFSSVELAIRIKGMIESGSLSGYENCDVEYSDDPCAIKDGKPCSMGFYRTW